MSSRSRFPLQKTCEVRDACLCLHVQQVARMLARTFDDLFRPYDLTNGQFSLLMSLNRPAPPTMGEVASLLAMDRTSLTAMLKPLERRRLAKVVPDEKDRRKHRLVLTDEGHKLLLEAYPLWKKAHDALEKTVADADRLRADLSALLENSPHHRESTDDR